MISAITCMAVAIYFEARNQPIAGQLAVAHVISNRVASRHYPDTVCEVIQQGAANSRSGAMASRKPYRIITHGEPPCE